MRVDRSLTPEALIARDAARRILAPFFSAEKVVIYIGTRETRMDQRAREARRSLRPGARVWKSPRCSAARTGRCAVC
jgi:hypothetical protein